MIRKCIKDYNKGEIKIWGRVYGYTRKVAKWMGLKMYNLGVRVNFHCL